MASSTVLRPIAQLGLGLRLRRWVHAHAFSLGVLVVLLIVVGIPLIYMLNLSFRNGTPATPGELTLENYRRAYGNPQTKSALANTLVYAAAVSAISLALAALFAWLIERTDLPWRHLAWVVMLLPIAIPGMLSSMSMILLFSKEIGILNILIREMASWVGHDIATGPLNIYSMPGLILVEGVRGSTSIFLMLVAAFRLMDPSMEEAASISGARTWYTMRKITLRLMAPALLAAGMYAMVGNLDDLEAALIIGVPAGIFLLPTLIYFTSRGGDWGLSAAYSTIFLLLTIIMVVIYYAVVLRKSGNFATITGKAYRPRRISLGKWRYVGFGAFALYAFVNIALPVLVLLWASLLPAYEVPSWDAVSKLGFTNYIDLFQQPGIIRATLNTINLAVISATITMVLAFIVAWVVVRQKVKGGLGLDALAFIPHAIPSVAVAIALVALYLSPAMRWTQIYGTVIIMSLAMLTRLITFGSRQANSAMAQLSAELEEAAYMGGVGRMRTLFRITLRLLAPAFLAGWLYVAASAIRNLTIPLLLAGRDSQTLSSTLYFYWYRNADFSAAAALGVMMLIFLAILAIFARKLISGGYSGSE